MRDYYSGELPYYRRNDLLEKFKPWLGWHKARLRTLVGSVVERGNGSGLAYRFQPDILVSMDDLQRSLQEIEGYLALSMWEEANEAVEDLPPEAKTRLDVLDFRVRIYQELEAYELMQVVAENLVRGRPNASLHWIQYAMACRYTGGIGEGLDALRRALKRFPREAGVLYPLALHEAEMGELEAASEHLKLAIEIDPAYRHFAEKDPELRHFLD